MKKYIRLLTIGLCMVLLSACGKKEEVPEGTVYKICYLNDKDTKLITREYQSDTTAPEELVQELLTQLRVPAEKKEYDPVENRGFTIQSTMLFEDTLTLDVDDGLLTIEPMTGILIRAALVRTFTQIKEVRNVVITVSGEALTDSNGTIIGPMQAEQFIDNAGDEISPVENVTMTLYFANESGDRLRTEVRTIEYNSNISMDKLVVEQLIAGPSEGCGLPAINPAAKLLGVTTKDGICYVNLDAAFLLQTFEVSPEVTIYSIVNSLVELSNVNKVQISVEGETNVMFRENMNLANLYERNLDILDTEQ